MFPTYPKPQVLLFNIIVDERGKKLENYLRASGVAVRHVLPSEFGHPIGYLLSLPGFEDPHGMACLPFSEEMMLMSGFDRQRLDALLAFFSREELRRIELKAMLTPTNASWNAAELYRHLSAERRQFSALK